MQESEARLRAIGNALPDIVFVIDEDGRFVEILTAASNMNFLAANKLKNQRFHEVFPPALAERFLAAVHEMITAGQSQLLECDLNLKPASISSQLKEKYSNSNVKANSAQKPIPYQWWVLRF